MIPATTGITGQHLPAPGLLPDVECRACGHSATENRKNQAEFCCVIRGHANHADTNAAQIVLARGIALAPTPGHEGQDPHHGSARGNPDTLPVPWFTEH